jgi:hypothetical protein
MNRSRTSTAVPSGWAASERSGEPGKSLVASAREILDTLSFEAGEDIGGAVGDPAGEAGEPGDVDAVGGGLGARLDTVEEHYFSSHLVDDGLVVLAAGQNVRELGKLMIVCREERQSLHVVVQVLGDGPG